MTQGNSIAGALHSTFSVPTWVTGIVITVVSLLIIVGGIKSISKVSSIVVPVMAIFMSSVDDRNLGIFQFAVRTCDDL